MAGVQSIERAFSLLRALSVQPGGVTELSERVDLPKSTVARLLNALESEGAIEQAEVGGVYRLGGAIEEIAGTAGQGRSLIVAARPFLVELAEATGEASGVDIFEDGWVQFVDQVETTQEVQVRDWTGEWSQAHAVPAGIVMLAHAGEQAVREYINKGLEPYTPQTLVSGPELRERLSQARSAGYVWGFEEFAEGINSVAAPVLGPDGAAVAALHVHGPTYRFPDPNRTHDLGLLLSDAATRLGNQLQQFAN